MNKFRIIPVIDIMNGIAVHANKGVRNEYLPIHMKFSISSQPIDLITTFFNNFGFAEVYIADLDSIIREKPNFDLLRMLGKDSPLKIMLDAGIRNLYDVIQFKSLGLSKIILATETIDSFSVIDDTINELGREHIIVSIDMKHQKLISESAEIARMDIKEIMEKLLERDIMEIILLDLAKIGSMEGDSASDYKNLRTQYPKVNFIVGGGVKDMKDINALKSQGFNGALVATALHKGIIKPSEIQSFYNLT
ncbi:MAG: hypothetical protein JW776_03020 [Candidatus Lokiarchaeota archaeon]|nr:hypothetical protein [Candidatus Lokiarchaeota archaeon]